VPGDVATEQRRVPAHASRERVAHVGSAGGPGNVHNTALWEVNLINMGILKRSPNSWMVDDGKYIMDDFGSPPFRRPPYL
jgi:hypothetical protein